MLWGQQAEGACGYVVSVWDPDDVPTACVVKDWPLDCSDLGRAGRAVETFDPDGGRTWSTDKVIQVIGDARCRSAIN